MPSTFRRPNSGKLKYPIKWSKNRFSIIKTMMVLILWSYSSVMVLLCTKVSLIDTVHSNNRACGKP